MALRNFATVVGFLSLLSACASDSGSKEAGPGADASKLAPFSAYCTGSLKTERQALPSGGPSLWRSTSSQQSLVEPGETILLGAVGGLFDGYVVLTNGVPAKLKANIATGLVKDSDFAADCADVSKATPVLLKRSTFFVSQDLSGHGCSLEAGTALTSFSFNAIGGTASLTADQITAACNLDKDEAGQNPQVYSADVIYATLMAK